MMQHTRRQTLAILGGAAFASRLEAASCLTLAAPQTEGPYWVDENLNRSDIRVDPSDGSVRPGVLLNLTINVQEVSTCTPLTGAHVDIWHCDASGLYSDEAANNTVGKKFLRGYQVTDDNGNVQFTTIYPGWYSGRTVHIHVRIRTYSGSTQLDAFTAQLFFDDSITDSVFTQSPYNTRGTRDTRNSNDMVLTGTSGGTILYLALSQSGSSYTASAAIRVNLKSAAVSLPAINSGGVVSAASYQAGAAPGSWVAIFGQNLAAATHTLASSDLVSGAMPTTLSGVSVQIDGKAEFPYYVSPTLVNVLAPADTNLGSVSVTVSNATGTSAAATVSLQSRLPAFFAPSNYIAAVRLDGTIITSSVPARPGDVLLLFGTGFGPTTPSVSHGTIFSGSAPLDDSVAVMIGGVSAAVSYAGLVGPGLYQINLTVPALSTGDHEVIAGIAGLSTPSGVLLRTRS